MQIPRLVAAAAAAVRPAVRQFDRGEARKILRNE
jgi:hypothetical protein